MAEEKKRTIRVVLTEPQPGAADGLQARLATGIQSHGDAALGAHESELVKIVGYARDGLEAAQMATQLAPDVILVHEELPGMDGYEACEMMSLAAPNVASVLLVDHSKLGDEQMNKRALRAGARAVLASDSSTEALLEALTSLAELSERRQRPEYELITDPMKMPVTIAVTGAKGGVGKTTLAANLAVSFARRFADEVLLVDFYGQYGNVPLMLDLSVNGNIGELADFAAELDINIIETNLAQHEASSLKVLPGSPELIETRLPNLAMAGGWNEVAFVADLVGLLRRHYRFLFFDIPPLVGKASAYVFSRCQYVLLVTSLQDLNMIRDTATLYRQLLDMHIAPEHIKLILNRSSRDSEFTIEDLEQTTGTKVAFELPDDPTAAVAAINEGVPCVISRPGCGLSRSVGKLAEILVGELADMALGSGT